MGEVFETNFLLWFCYLDFSPVNEKFQYTDNEIFYKTFD